MRGVFRRREADLACADGGWRKIVVVQTRVAGWGSTGWDEDVGSIEDREGYRSSNRGQGRASWHNTPCSQGQNTVLVRSGIGGYQLQWSALHPIAPPLWPDNVHKNHPQKPSPVVRDLPLYDKSREICCAFEM